MCESLGLFKSVMVLGRNISPWSPETACEFCGPTTSFMALSGSMLSLRVVVNYTENVSMGDTAPPFICDMPILPRQGRDAPPLLPVADGRGSPEVIRPGKLFLPFTS